MPRKGFWNRPVTRMYSYNLDVGEHYYSPMTSYLEAERGTRGETPGALTYSERLARKWLYGRRYGATDCSERYCRASSVARAEGMSVSAMEAEAAAARRTRALSEVRAAATNDYNVRAWGDRRELLSRAMTASGYSAGDAAQAESKAAAASRESASAMRAETARVCSSSSSRRQQQQSSSSSSTAVVSASTTVSKQVSQQKMASSSSQQQASSSSSSSMRQSGQVIRDDICKRVADVHMQPWSAGMELDEANSASARARARIADLERELEEITRRAMTATSTACKSAKLMAQEACMEDEAAMKSSYKKSKKVMIESSAKVAA